MVSMEVDRVMTLDKAYRTTIDGLRELGWKDLALDSKRKGINARFQGENDIWELLIHFRNEGNYLITSRSTWKVQNNTSDLVQHLVEKINHGNPKHDFRMNDRGSFEVKTSANILDKSHFFEEMKGVMISNIQAYESYSSMLKRFVNITPEYLKKETEGFRALISSKNPSKNIQDDEIIRLNLQK